MTGSWMMALLFEGFLFFLQEFEGNECAEFNMHTKSILLLPFPEINIAPVRGPFQKEMKRKFSFQPQCFRCYVSFGGGYIQMHV